MDKIGTRLIKQLGGLMIKRNGGRIETEIPGFSYCEFDRHGQLAVWNLCKAMELDRFINQVFSKRSSPYLVVNSGERWSMSSTVYNNAALNYPMIYSIGDSTRQKNSFVNNFSLMEKASGVTLVSSVRQLVFIDKATRKAISIPESSDVSKCPVSSTKFFIMVAKKPDTHYKMTRVAQFSDYDMSKHVNATSYVRWMIDAAAEAAANGALARFRKDFDYCAEIVEMLYRKECFAGDQVCIHVWEEAPLVLCFDIQKLGEEGTVTFGRIKFYKDLFKSRI